MSFEPVARARDGNRASRIINRIFDSQTSPHMGGVINKGPSFNGRWSGLFRDAYQVIAFTGTLCRFALGVIRHLDYILLKASHGNYGKLLKQPPLCIRRFDALTGYVEILTFYFNADEFAA